MKKIIVILIVLSSMAWACEVPYEEVGGVKIGCLLSKTDDNKTEGIANIGGKELKVYLVKNARFFDYGVIITDNSEIIGVDFYKSYVFTDKTAKDVGKIFTRDFGDFRKSLEERWGNGEYTDLFDQSSLAIMQPKSDVLGGIALVATGNIDFDTTITDHMKANLRLSYLGKKLVLLKEEQSDTSRQTKTEGF